MKTKFNYLAYLVMLISTTITAQNVSISATGVAPSGDAGLDVNFTDKGLLIPRVSLTNTGTYGLTGGGPTNSMLVYNNNVGIAGTGAMGVGYYYWNSTLGRWVRLLAASSPSDAWLTTGNAGTTAGTHFIGTTDNVSLVFKTNNTEIMRITSAGNVGIGTTAPANKLGVVGGYIAWGNAGEVSLLQNDQGGSIELGGQNSLANPNANGMPYIDFHYGTGASQDYNARIINAANNRIDITTNAGGFASLNGTNFGIGTTSPTQRLDVAGNVQFSNALMPGGNAGSNGQVLISQGGGVAPIWGSPGGNNVVSVSLATDQNLGSTSWADVPGMSITFTALSSQAFVMLSASGFGYTNSMSYVQFRVYNVTSSSVIGGTNEKIQNYDDVTGTITPWSCSFMKLVTGLTPGTSYTFKVQYLVNGILGTYNAVINASTNPNSNHLSLSILR